MKLLLEVLFYALLAFMGSHYLATLLWKNNPVACALVAGVFTVLYVIFVKVVGL